MSELRNKLSTITIVQFTAFCIHSEECFFDMTREEINEHLLDMCSTVIIYSYVEYSVKLNHSELVRGHIDDVIFDKLNQNKNEKDKE